VSNGRLASNVFRLVMKDVVNSKEVDKNQNKGISIDKLLSFICPRIDREFRAMNLESDNLDFFAKKNILLQKKIRENVH
jgi:hypothetical protein